MINKLTLAIAMLSLAMIAAPTESEAGIFKRWKANRQSSRCPGGVCARPQTKAPSAPSVASARPSITTLYQSKPAAPPARKTHLAAPLPAASQCANCDCESLAAEVRKLRADVAEIKAAIEFGEGN